MDIPEKFLSLTCCPKRNCRGDLVLDKANSLLRCSWCQDEYPIINGIPVLFPNAAHSPDIHKRHWDQEANVSTYAKKYNNYLKKEGAPWGLYTHVSEMEAIKKLTKNINLSGKTILDCGCGNGRFEALNWPAKFLADLLMEFSKDEK